MNNNTITADHNSRVSVTNGMPSDAPTQIFQNAEHIAQVSCHWCPFGEQAGNPVALL